MHAETREDALAAMRRAAEYCDAHLAVEGGYVWAYAADLSKREGEGEVGETTVWVQPPGTPAVGMMYLRCYEATGDDYYLGLALKAGRVLLRGQMETGGWGAKVELAPAERSQFRYRLGEERRARRARTTSSFDDNQTQSALRLLMRLDAALGFEDEAIHEACQYAIEHIIEAQYPAGGWPQVFDGNVELAEPPVLDASYPESWSREYTGHNRYWRWYTLNDGAMLDTIDVLFEAAEVYDDPAMRDAAIAGADFLLRAQMPDPQPGWAQQYDYDMHPAWARRFEPPAITGSESQHVMLTLIDVYHRTGDAKYLDAVGQALAYFKASRLSGGGLARFYELETNRPLFMTRDYELTYDADDVPGHYAFTVSDRLDRIERLYNEAVADGPLDAGSARAQSIDRLARRAREAMDAQAAYGPWLTEGPMRFAGPADRVIDMAEYVRRMDDLAAFLAATRPE
ncbi:hypothetical protein OT109_17640 [Phycisphaeraceae bacterium D3-23]